MGRTKDAQQAVIDAKIPSTIQAGLEALAKGLGVAAIELWSIFVRQYVVKGVTELFTALVLVGCGVFLTTVVGYWSLIAFAASLPFFYGTILLLGNPKYYAIQDITQKIDELR
tara:strand:- start:957 stop:1295 length:339 start_codon:yes stop_codon:yes gene_type:complete